MSTYEEDKLNIERDAFLKRKRILDLIAKRIINNPSLKVIEFNISQFRVATGVDNHDELLELFKFLMKDSKKIIFRIIDESFLCTVEVRISSRVGFEKYHREIADRYHELNNQKVKAKKGEAIIDKDFSFMKDGDIKKIVERDYKELQSNSLSKNNKAIMILSGSIMESLLLDYCLHNKDRVKNFHKAPKNKKGKVKDLYEWDLIDLINICSELEPKLKIFERLGHSAREFRNLVHPGRELKTQGLKVDGKEAGISVYTVNILIRSLKEIYQEEEEFRIKRLKEQSNTIG